MKISKMGMEIAAKVVRPNISKLVTHTHTHTKCALQRINNLLILFCILFSISFRNKVFAEIGDTDISGSQISCNFTKRNNQILIEAINLAKGFYIVKLIGKQNIVINASFVKE